MNTSLPEMNSRILYERSKVYYIPMGSLVSVSWVRAEGLRYLEGDIRWMQAQPPAVCPIEYPIDFYLFRIGGRNLRPPRIISYLRFTETPVSCCFATQKECIHKFFNKTLKPLPSRFKRMLYWSCNGLINIALGSKQYSHNAVHYRTNATFLLCSSDPAQSL